MEEDHRENRDGRSTFSRSYEIVSLLFLFFRFFSFSQKVNVCYHFMKIVITFTGVIQDEFKHANERL